MMRFHVRILFLLVLFCCFQLVPVLVINSNADGKEGTFTGTWVANGSKETLPFGANREAFLFKLSGHVNLQDKVGSESDYWSQCIGLADTETGSTVRCSWADSAGTKIFLILKGEGLSRGSSVTGEIIGGTGAAEGISGRITFKWSSMATHSVNDNTSVGGYAKELSGTYKLP